MFYLRSFMIFNEFSILILSYLIHFTENAQNDVAFQSKPVDVSSRTMLLKYI